MLRKFLDYQLSLTEKYPFFRKLRPAINGLDTFLYEAPDTTKSGPHIRDAVDLKRWMSLVVLALLPAILMAIWNTGLQSFVYSSGDYQLMDEYLSSLGSMGDYFSFVFKNDRYLTILKEGLLAFMPVMIVSYAVGGLWEVLFASVRGHDIAEGFLVTGILYPLILPPTIPLWMVAVGVSAGVVLSKELFGGTGMNIMNPALACRTFLFFTFPGKMSGDVWVGRDPSVVRESLLKMNQESGRPLLDGYTQASLLSKFNINPEVKKIHIDAIASNTVGRNVDTAQAVEKYLNKWNAASGQETSIGNLTIDQMREFVTSPLTDSGLGLSPGAFEDAYQFSSLQYGVGEVNSTWGFFLGNKLGSMGETSTIACLVGAFLLVYMAIGSWKTMVAMLLGAFATASLFQYGSLLLGAEGGAWAPAQFAFPAYKHLLLGGMAFGLVYMATDPVSSPGMDSAKWIYGVLIGTIAIVIRVINPAYPEGVMLAIILGNCFAPLIDYYATKRYRRKRRVIPTTT